MSNISKKSISKKIKNFISRNSVLPGIFSNPCHIEINSNEEIIVEGSKGVLGYDETSIHIDAGKMRLLFSGKKLMLKCSTSDYLIIRGEILSLEFQISGSPKHV